MGERWYISNFSRDYQPDLADRVAKANAATGKSVKVHDEPIPDGCLMGSPGYRAAWASDCRSISIQGGYQNMSDWWRVFNSKEDYQ